MENEGSLQYLQERNIEMYTKSNKTSPQPHTLLLCCPLYYYPPIYVSVSEENLSVFRLIFCCISRLSWVLHGALIL
jgi:hypothetical protein